MPLRHLDGYLNDERRLGLEAEAVEGAVAGIRSRGVDCRVLVLGAGAGLLPLVALRAGAFHVTCVER